MNLNNNLTPVNQGRFSRYLSRRYDSNQFTYKQIFKMLIPLLMDSMFISLINMLTISLISRSSETSMAAVALVSPLSMIIQTFSFAMSSGGTVIVAQYKGKGDQSLVKRAATQVIIITFLMATAATVVIILFAKPMLAFIYPSADPLVLKKATDYLVGFCFSIPFFSIFNGIFNVLRGVGETKICLHLTILINIIHLFASFIFINLLGLDIMGTAISFNIARVIGCFFAIYVITRPNSSLTLKLRDFKHFDISMQKSIIKIGIPFGIESIFMHGGMLLSQVYMAGLGTVILAANNSANAISQLLYSIGSAVATLAITVVGQSIGAGDIKAAKKYGKSFIRLGTVSMVLALCVLTPMLPLILKLFNPSPQALPAIISALLIGAIPIPFLWSLANVLPSVLRAAGDASYTSYVSLGTMWAARVFIGYLLAIPLGLGLNGIWISVGIEWAIRSVIFWYRFKGSKWLEKKVV